jgi:hypothetical protein
MLVSRRPASRAAVSAVRAPDADARDVQMVRIAAAVRSGRTVGLLRNQRDWAADHRRTQV